ncbi:MAG: spermidine/putrescine ABC transporter substrate-binding protein PotD, partial [Pseudomonadales bacterium]
MKLMTKTAMALALIANSAAANGELVIYHWFEYMPAELLEKFTAETGLSVTMDTFHSNEAML